MLSPLPRHSVWVPLCSITPAVSVFPGSSAGSTCAFSFSRLARRSLALRPAHSRRHQSRDALHQRLRLLRYLHSRSGCFRLEHSPGGTLTHWKTPPFHGAPALRKFTGLSWLAAFGRSRRRAIGSQMRSKTDNTIDEALTARPRLKGYTVAGQAELPSCPPSGLERRRINSAIGTTLRPIPISLAGPNVASSP